jgi:hypothetical protein
MPQTQDLEAMISEAMATKRTNQGTERSRRNCGCNPGVETNTKEKINGG